MKIKEETQRTKANYASPHPALLPSAAINCFSFSPLALLEYFITFINDISRNEKVK